MVNILGICGSLRIGSFNKACLFVAREVAPPGVDLEIYSSLEFPAFSEDLEGQFPPVVAALKEKIKAADGILVATPEYNHTLPGGLKNVIDWTSRPRGDNSWGGKPVAIMSASTGMLGGVRAQLTFRQMAVYLNLRLLNQPEVFIPFVHTKVVGGKMADAETRGYIKKLMEALLEEILRKQ
jgi:chromate reductase, NAD(P)H dehydrogenase (quinone)